MNIRKSIYYFIHMFITKFLSEFSSESQDVLSRTVDHRLVEAKSCPDKNRGITTQSTTLQANHPTYNFPPSKTYHIQPCLLLSWDIITPFTSLTHTPTHPSPHSTETLSVLLLPLLSISLLLLLPQLQGPTLHFLIIASRPSLISPLRLAADTLSVSKRRASNYRSLRMDTISFCSSLAAVGEVLSAKRGSRHIISGP